METQARRRKSLIRDEPQVYAWVGLSRGQHPLVDLWDPSFEPRDGVDRLDVQVRALRGQIMKQRPVTIRAVTLDQARRFVAFVHTHAPLLTGWKFGTSAWDAVGMIGVVTVGRPVSRVLQARGWLEVNRCCLMRHAPKNAASMLLGRACRVAGDLGFPKIVSYTLEHEDGTSLKAAGFSPVALSAGGEHDRPSRPREAADFDTGPKIRWERNL